VLLLVGGEAMQRGEGGGECVRRESRSGLEMQFLFEKVT
jgi:hypothetical protein